MRKINQVGIFVVALTVLLVSCKKKDVKVETVELPKVKVQQAVERNVEQSYELTATVQPEVKNNISPSSPGRIREIFVKVGSHVVKGQKLVQMDAVNLSTTETQIENMRRMYKRTKELFAVGGASQQELDNAKLQVDVAENNLKNLTENTALLSPVTGIVTAKNYDNGDMSTIQQPILTVMQINPVKIVVNVSESFYSQVKLGMPVEVKFEVLQSSHFEGRVSLIYPTIDEKTRTFGVELKLNNPGLKILPGMFARAKFEFGEAKRVLIPDLAIVKQTGSGTRFVYVLNGSKVELKQVELGRRFDSEVEILSGLSATEKVVVSGQSKLNDGCEVKVVE
jgi:RND family efflux transporter MFP subunit